MDESTFLDALYSFNKNIQTDVNKKLLDIARLSAAYHQTIENIYSETRIRNIDWKTLINTIYSLSNNNDDIIREIKLFCRNHLLEGNTASIEQKSILGRVCYFNDFCRILVKNKSFFDIHEAKASLRRIIGIPINNIPKYWLNKKIGMYIMWSNFNEAGGRPFSCLPANPNTILCVLGIKPVSGVLLFLEYILPENIPPLIPTICDAYAAEYWTRYFRPAPQSAPFGITMPTDNCILQTGQPEVVHEVLTARSLYAELRYRP